MSKDVTVAGLQAALERRQAREGEVEKEVEELQERIRKALLAGGDSGKLRDQCEARLRELHNLRADRAILEEELERARAAEADAEKRGKEARAPVVNKQMHERLAGPEARLRAVLLEAKQALEVELTAAVAEAQQLYAKAFGDREQTLDRRLQALEYVVKEGLRLVGEGGAG